jgi:predicted CopG family antitoxin
MRERFINYNYYNDYRYYNMANTVSTTGNTTIAITNEIKEEISELGNKGETYSQILARLIASAKKRQLHDLLMNEEESISIEEAISNAKKKWQK